MKKEKLYETLGDINENYVNEAHMTTKKSSPGWLRWGAVAACFALLVLMATVVPLMDDPGTSQSADALPSTGPHLPSTTGDEFLYVRGYFYHVDEGIFSTYVGGKVIAEEKLGDKMDDVSVTAGWKDSNGEWIFTENLRGEIYEIDNVSSDVAVALKFLDLGQAVTTTHYYVILNPNADLSVVEEYILSTMVPNNPGDEIAGEILE